MNKPNEPPLVVRETFNPISVSIGQFYGIEINNFTVTIAKTALWIAERLQEYLIIHLSC